MHRPCCHSRSSRRSCGAPVATTDITERLSPSSSDTNDEPRLTQVSNQGDSQATEVGDDIDADGQARSSLAFESDSSTRVELAFESNRSLEDGGGSGREVLERAPSRMNGVPDDAPDCPSPI